MNLPIANKLHWKTACIVLLVLLAIASARFWLLQARGKTSTAALQRELRDAQASLSYYKSLLSITPKPSPTPDPDYKVVLEHPCFKTDQAYWSSDKLIVVCQKEESFKLFLKDSKYGYIKRGVPEAPQSVKAGRYVYVAFVHNMDETIYHPNYLIGSIVVRLDTVRKSLDVVADPRSIPNKDLFTDALSYTPSFWLLPQDTEGLFSPNQRHLILGVVRCSGCETTIWLYVLDTTTKKLYFLGEPKNNEFRWLDEKTIQWRAGKTRETTETDLGHEYPVITDDLGYRTFTVPE